MEIESTFIPGSKHVLLYLLRAIKDFNRPNSLSLKFSSTGLGSQFTCGPPSDPKSSIVSFTLYPPSTSLTKPVHVPNPSSSTTTPTASKASGSPTKIEINTSASSTSTTVQQFSSILSRLITLRDGTESVITVHPRTLFHQLELMDEDDKITIRAEGGVSGMIPIYELYFESADLGRKVLYEMDTVPKSEPWTLPTGIKYAFVVQIEALEFLRTIAALQDTSDKVTITGTKNSITFCASGPSGTLQVGLVQKPPTSPEKVQRLRILSYTSPSIKQTYDTRFLRGFTVGCPLGTYVTLSFPAAPSPSPQMKITHPIEVDAVENLPVSIRLATQSQNLANTGIVTGSVSGSTVSQTPSRPGSPTHIEVPEKGGDVKGRMIVGKLEYYLSPIPELPK